MKKLLSFFKKHILLIKITLVTLLVSSAVLTTPALFTKRVAILYICTGRYIVFWDGFYETMEKNFLPDYRKTYFVFTDDTEKVFPPNVVKIYQKQMPWPFITLMRYHFFQKIIPQLQKYDYVYFLNANMRPLQRIGSEILPSAEQGLVVTKHPGFYYLKKAKFFPYERNKKSRAYVPIEKGQHYVMGGFNGGQTKDFICLTNTIVKWVDYDLKKNIMAKWHDESYLNRYIVSYMKKKTPLILSERYGTAEGYDYIRDPIMLVLDKDKFGGHKYLRSDTVSKKPND